LAIVYVITVSSWPESKYHVGNRYSIENPNKLEIGHKNVDGGGDEMKDNTSWVLDAQH
jgi:hypothetical protein